MVPFHSPCSNDAFDATTGVDVTKPESVVNLTGNWPLVFWLSIAFLVAGVSLMGRLVTATGDGRIIAMLALSIACGYVYQGPPFRCVDSFKGTFQIHWNILRLHLLIQ
jgi:1,4-dihydroxy-2-naphthoate octaprenyltransferase